MKRFRDPQEFRTGLRARLRADERASRGGPHAARRPRTPPLRVHRPGAGAQRRPPPRTPRRGTAGTSAGCGGPPTGSRPSRSPCPARRPTASSRARRTWRWRVALGRVKVSGPIRTILRLAPVTGAIHPVYRQWLEQTRPQAPPGLTAMRTPLANVDASWLRMDEPNNQMVVTGVLVLETPGHVAAGPDAAPAAPAALRALPAADRPAAGRRGTPVLGGGPGLLARPPSGGERFPAAADEAALQTLHQRPRQPSLSPDAGRPGVSTSSRTSGRIGAGRPDPPLRSPTGSRWSTCCSRWPTARRSSAIGGPEPSGPAPAPLPRYRARPSPRATRAAPRRAPSHLGCARPAAPAPSRTRSTRFKGALGMEKKLVWSRPFQLDDFKRVGRATGSTVNDVLMAALAGALRRYLLAHGEVPAEARRPRGRAGQPPAGQRGASAGEPLRAGLPPAAARHRHVRGTRLAEIRRRMRALKESPGAAATFELLWVLGHGAPAALRCGGRPLRHQGHRGGDQRHRSRRADLHPRRAPPAGDVLGPLRRPPRAGREPAQLRRAGLGGGPERRGADPGSRADRLDVRGGAGRAGRRTAVAEDQAPEGPPAPAARRRSARTR